MSDARELPLPDELGPLRDGDPASIGPFAIIGRLGEGGMGVVYGGVDTSGRCVAVKVIAAQHAGAPEFRSRFERETALVRDLSVTCAPAFLGAGEQGGQPWLATEFVPGRNLRAHVAEFGPLHGAPLRAFAAGIAEAVSALHAAGVTHRDLKPGNVVLSPDGPKVLDFGIAHAHGNPGDDPSPRMGSPGWMAPERMKGSASQPAGDVFCWGLLVAFAATGAHAFGDAPSAELAARIRDDQEPDLGQLPPELAALVSAALAHDPAQRPTAQATAWAVLGPQPERPPESAEASRPPGDEAFTAPFGGDGGPGAAPPVGSAELTAALLELLRETWEGIDAAGHDPDAWRALGAASGLALGTGTSAVAAHSAASAGKTGALVKGGAAVATAGAVAVGGYFAIDALGEPDEQPAVAASEAPTAQTSPAESPGPEQEAEGQEIDFRTLTARVPEEWTETEDAFGIEDALVLDTHDPECDEPPADEPDSTANSGAVSRCGHVVMYGPERIHAEGDAVWGPLNETSTPANRTDVGFCLPGMDFLDAGQDQQTPMVEDLAPIGDRDAYYREWAVTCGPHPEVGVPELDGQSYPFHYRLRAWYLPESEIYIVDEWNTRELDDILAAGRFG